MIAAIGLGERSDDFDVASTPIFLGSYRLLLAFFVFCSHSSWPLAHILIQADIAVAGVTNFFIVSGFLITLTIELNYTDSIRGFLLNRFLRIYPTFWISMVVAVLAILATGSTYLAPNFYLRGWTWDNILRCVLIFPATGGNDTWGPIPIGWTLQIELSFYLVLAAVYFLIGELPRRTRHKTMLWICMGCLIGYAVMLATVTLGWFNALLFTPFFVAGTLTAIITRLDADQRAMRLTGTIVLAAALGLCAYYIFGMLPLTPQYRTGTTVALPIVCGLFFLLLWPPIASRFSRFKRIDTLLGDFTYPVYTLHFALNQVLAFWLFAYVGPPIVFLQIGVVLAASYLVLRFVDRPLSKLRTRVRSDAAASATPPTTIPTTVAIGTPKLARAS